MSNSILLFRQITSGRDADYTENRFIAPVIVVNPFTGDQHEIPVDYPGLEESHGFFDFNSKMMVYDTSQNLVIYPQYDNGCYYALWDRQARKILARLEMDACLLLGGPIWLPDESGFLISAVKDRKAEWFQVNRNGETHQLTNMGGSFDLVNISPWAALSPDGHYLAFPLRIKPGPYDDYRLAVLDMKTLEVTYYGIPPGTVPGSYLDIEWSPDSRYIAIGNTDVNGANNTILVDIVDRWAARLVDDALPRGWMVSP